MTTPQSPVVPITAETVVPFPCWLEYKTGPAAGWSYHIRWVAPECATPQSMGYSNYCQNPPDRMPGAVEEKPLYRCKKCGHTFDYPDGKQYRDGDVDVWCPKCGANDDHFEDVAAPTPTASTLDDPRRVLVESGPATSGANPAASGDPCARAAEEVAEMIEAQNHAGERHMVDSIAAIIRREVAGHYEKEIERANRAIAKSYDALGNECQMGAHLHDAIAALRARLATAERERDEALKIMADNMAEASRQVEASDKLYRQMCARLSSAEADSKRLDWLEAITPEANVYIRKVIGQREESLYGWRTSRLRELIDAAQQQHKEE